MRRFLLTLLALCVTAGIACKRHESSRDLSAPATLVDLSPSLDPVRAAFNAHMNEARFVAMMSPT